MPAVVFLDETQGPNQGQQDAAAFFHHQSDPGVVQHAVRRLRRWLRRHKVRSGGYVRFSDVRLRETYGLTCLVSKTKGFPWAKA